MPIGDALAVGGALSISPPSKVWTDLRVSRQDAGVQPDAGVIDISRGDQVDCVRRLGGCANTRPAGIPTTEDIRSYNQQCRQQTGWRGNDVIPTDEECRVGALRAPTPQNITVLDWGQNWNVYNLTGGVLSIGEIDATGVRDMVDQIKAALAGPPRPECIGDLTIIGHGSPGSISVGSGTGYVRGATIDGGALDPTSPAYDPVMRATLAELTPLFCSTAAVTLRGCNVGDGALGTAFVRRLADLWQVRVRAHVGTIRGGGFWTTGQWTSANPRPLPAAAASGR